jgi:hypothetical protein
MGRHPQTFTIAVISSRADHTEPANRRTGKSAGDLRERIGIRRTEARTNTITCLDYASLLAIIIPGCSTNPWGIGRAFVEV